jgi:hypothetical protein
MVVVGLACPKKCGDAEVGVFSNSVSRLHICRCSCRIEIDFRSDHHQGRKEQVVSVMI